MSGERLPAWLRWSWWFVVPPIGALAVRLAFERACESPYELAAALMSRSRPALLVALLYLGAHVWAVVAYLLTIERTRTLVPSLGAVRRLWGSDVIKLAIAAAVLALEHAPVRLWRLLGRAVLGCGP